MNWKPTSLSFICSKHFRDEDFITKKSENTRAKLKKDAVPSIFDFPKYLKKETKIRPPPKKRKFISAEHQDIHAVKKNVLHDHSYACMSYKQNIYSLKSKIMKIKKKYIMVYQNKCRKDQKIVHLTSLIREMREKNIILPETEEIITSNSDGLALQLIKNEKRNRARKKPIYNKTIKAFAITLHYLSASAYKFLSKHFKLPSERMIRYWSSNLKIEPGFTEQVFNKLNQLVHDKKNSTTVFSYYR